MAQVKTEVTIMITESECRAVWMALGNMAGCDYESERQQQLGDALYDLMRDKFGYEVDF